MVFRSAITLVVLTSMLFSSGCCWRRWCCRSACSPCCYRGPEVSSGCCGSSSFYTPATLTSQTAPPPVLTVPGPVVK